MRVKISFAKVITTPPASVRKPFALWDGSWDFSDKPTCTMPKAEHNHPDRPYQTEDEIGEVVDNGNRVIGGKGGHGRSKTSDRSQYRHAVEAETLFTLPAIGSFWVAFFSFF